MAKREGDVGRTEAVKRERLKRERSHGPWVRRHGATLNFEVHVP